MIDQYRTSRVPSAMIKRPSCCAIRMLAPPLVLGVVVDTEGGKLAQSVLKNVLSVSIIREVGQRRNDVLVVIGDVGGVIAVLLA